MGTHIATTLLAILLMAPGTGCGGLFFMGRAGTSTIAFTSDELRSTEEAGLVELDAACRDAIRALGYDKIETIREIDRIRWKARTAGGDPVEIQLKAKDRNRTDLRIRIGVIGDEARSRLVLEEIRQSLSRSVGPGSSQRFERASEG